MTNNQVDSKTFGWNLECWNISNLFEGFRGRLGRIALYHLMEKVDGKAITDEQWLTIWAIFLATYAQIDPSCIGTSRSYLQARLNRPELSAMSRVAIQCALVTLGVQTATYYPDIIAVLLDEDAAGHTLITDWFAKHLPPEVTPSFLKALRVELKQRAAVPAKILDIFAEMIQRRLVIEELVRMLHENRSMADIRDYMGRSVDPVASGLQQALNAWLRAQHPTELDNRKETAQFFNELVSSLGLMIVHDGVESYLTVAPRSKYPDGLLYLVPRGGTKQFVTRAHFGDMPDLNVQAKPLGLDAVATKLQAETIAKTKAVPRESSK